MDRPFGGIELTSLRSEIILTSHSYFKNYERWWTRDKRRHVLPVIAYT